ncbi:MAG: hypothetical protein AAB267_05080 [Candidatus Desantisbacteria bacterium]
MGCMHAFWMWVPVLIFKAIAAICRGLWTFILWILQTISGVPLYYCKPEFLIPAKIIGAIGILLLTGVALNIISLFSGIDTTQQDSISIVGPVFVSGVIGFLLLWGSRMLIRKGSM